MKKTLPLVVLGILVASCSSNPVGPSAEKTAAAKSGGDEGTVSSTAITTERIRLQRTGVSDIATEMISGRTYDVPLNVPLDVWAEIRRLESDRGRLLVDWGNGFTDFTGCGSCRVDYTYTREGRYTLTAKVVDLGVPLDSQIITSVTVILNVYDFDRRDHTAGLSCSSVSNDFEGVAFGKRFPIALPGVTFSAANSGLSFLSRALQVLGGFNNLSGRALFPAGDMTITFDSDKNYATIAYAALFTNLVPQEVTYKAYDSLGRQVGSGSRTPTVPGGVLSAFREDALTVSGPTFRSIVVSSSHLPPNILFDNLNAACR